MPIPRREFVDPIERMIGDAPEQVAQVSLVIEAVEFSGLLAAQ